MRHTELFALPNWWRAVAFFALLTPFAGPPAFAQHEHSSSTFEVFVAAEGLAGHGQPHPREDDPWVDADVLSLLVFNIAATHAAAHAPRRLAPDKFALSR
jgi:hypothetical protein